MIAQFAGEKDEQSFQPALVEIEEALVPAFIIEKHADGQFTVFVSSRVLRRWLARFTFCSLNACTRWMFHCAKRWFA
jgi:hypothetical protein